MTQRAVGMRLCADERQRQTANDPAHDTPPSGRLSRRMAGAERASLMTRRAAQRKPLFGNAPIFSGKGKAQWGRVENPVQRVSWSRAASAPRVDVHDAIRTAANADGQRRLKAGEESLHIAGPEPSADPQRSSRAVAD